MGSADVRVGIRELRAGVSRYIEEGLIRQGERRRRPLPEPLEIEDLDLQAFLRDQRR
jgi:hypothetical protein